MSKIASMKVQVVADTSQFNSQMAAVRAQLKNTARASSLAGASGLAGPMGGRIAGFAGLMGLSGPMLAVAAGVTALSAGIARLQQSLEKDEQRKKAGFDAVIDGRMSPQKAAQFGQMAELIQAGATAADLQELVDKLGTPGASLADNLLKIKQMSLGPEGAALAGSRFLGDSSSLFNRLRFVSDQQIKSVGQPGLRSTELITRAAGEEMARQGRVASEEFLEPSLFGRFVDEMKIFGDYITSGIARGEDPYDFFEQRYREQQRAGRNLETIARKSGGPE